MSWVKAWSASVGWLAMGACNCECPVDTGEGCPEDTGEPPDTGLSTDAQPLRVELVTTEGDDWDLHLRYGEGDDCTPNPRPPRPFGCTASEDGMTHEWVELTQLPCLVNVTLFDKSEFAGTEINDPVLGSVKITVAGVDLAMFWETIEGEEEIVKVATVDTCNEDVWTRDP